MGMGQATLKEKSQVRTFTSFLNWGCDPEILGWRTLLICIQRPTFPCRYRQINLATWAFELSRWRDGRCGVGLRAVFLPV